ncbi:MAG TPA: hypothetical protein VGR26_00130 [Acidimicrobiales bacterium]|nr:hypothetical protein [Acidimicrobiales bacterium]
MSRKVVAWSGLCALVFGLLTSLPVVDHGTRAFLLAALVRGAIWGLLTFPLLYWALGRLDRRARARLRQPEKRLWEPVDAERTAALAVPLERAFDCVLAAVSMIPRSRITRADREMGVVEARVRMTWRSWGERILIELQPTGSSGTSVVVRSVPVLGLTIADYGKNRENVDAVVARLRAA